MHWAHTNHSKKSSINPQKPKTKTSHQQSRLNENPQPEDQDITQKIEALINKETQMRAKIDLDEFVAANKLWDSHPKPPLSFNEQQKQDEEKRMKKTELDSRIFKLESSLNRNKHALKKLEERAEQRLQFDDHQWYRTEMKKIANESWDWHLDVQELIAERDLSSTWKKKYADEYDKIRTIQINILTYTKLSEDAQDIMETFKRKLEENEAAIATKKASNENYASDEQEFEFNKKQYEEKLKEYNELIERLEHFKTLEQARLDSLNKKIQAKKDELTNSELIKLAQAFEAT